MSTGQGFELHPGAARDIIDIWEFIAFDNLRAAGRVREEILETFRRLASFPHSGHTRPDLFASAHVREYLIAYAPAERPLWVIAVIHGRRHPRVMAAILRGRE